MNKYWAKLGQIYVASQCGLHPKLFSHAANPLAVHLREDIFRIFYSSRDLLNRSSVGAIDYDIEKKTVVNIYEEPFFVHGSDDSFYSHGVSIGNCYRIDGQLYMLFMGWQNHNGSHWRGDIGRLLVTAEVSLKLASPKPLIGSDSIDPVSLSYPWVEPSSRGGFDMWYGSTLSWDAGNGEMLHVIHHATSEDGHVWSKTGLSLPYQLGKAQAFSRPTVLRDPSGLYEMWFSYRGGSSKGYRIGYARSSGEMSWQLHLDDAGIDVSTSGWDSEMIEYPFVFRHRGNTFMLYNGNSYGRSGFGLAVRE